MMKILPKPMLAAREFEPFRVQQQLPMWMQPKYDGIRMRIMNGVGISRSNIPLPNKALQTWVSEYRQFIEGYDGEVIVGRPTAPDVYNKTQSAIMSIEGSPDFSYYVYDLWGHTGVYDERLRMLQREVSNAVEKGFAMAQRLRMVPTDLVHSLDEIYQQEMTLLAMGYEGAILRGPQTTYKNGRATERQGQLLKLKRYQDAEARIVGFKELMHNENTAEVGELGQTKRSHHLAGKVAGNMLGALECLGEWPDGKEFEVDVGSGFDMALRQKIWDNQDAYMGKWVKFKYFEVGVKNSPRHPIFLGFRDPIDM